MELLTKTGQRLRRAILYLLIVLLTTATPAVTKADPSMTISEDQLSNLHAALILKIALFVEWPDNAPDLIGEKFPLGITGDDVVFRAFKEMAHKKIKDLSLEIVQHQDAEQLQTSRILFLSKDQLFKIQPWPGVLTISDSPNFNALGGIIKLSLENGRPRFTINLEAAEVAGIRFSSKLLKIATIYETETS